MRPALSSTYSLINWFLTQEGEVKGHIKVIFSGLSTCKIPEIIKSNILLKAIFTVFIVFLPILFLNLIY
ncbi:hypothetical protein LEP1GSC082_0370 [Leptospira kirschneri str. H2]|nr:hypothetical protein LEP1GSC082_0370 [Leptospira kirschneri str. H2]